MDYQIIGTELWHSVQKGAENTTADALSRVEEEKVICSALTTITPEWENDVVSSYAGDDFIAKILTTKQDTWDLWPYYSISEQILKYKGRIVVGNQSDLRTQILSTMHASAYGGHSGINGTYM